MVLTCWTHIPINKNKMSTTPKSSEDLLGGKLFVFVCFALSFVFFCVSPFYNHNNNMVTRYAALLLLREYLDMCMYLWSCLQFVSIRIPYFFKALRCLLFDFFLLLFVYFALVLAPQRGRERKRDNKESAKLRMKTKTKKLPTHSFSLRSFIHVMSCSFTLHLARLTSVVVYFLRSPFPRPGLLLPSGLLK